MEKEIIPNKIDEIGFYPLHMDHVPKYCYEKAMRELNETPETREVELKKLKDLLSVDKLTSGVVFEDDFLHQFLRHGKYNTERAFQYLLKYISFRRNNGSMFQSIPSEDFKGNPSTRFVSVLPYRSPDGCVVLLSQVGKWDPKNFSLEYFKREALFTFLQSLRCPMTQINGFKIIHDVKDSLKLMRYVTPQNLILMYSAAFACVPGRYKEVHLINKTAALTVAWAIAKHFLSEKLKKRFFFHSNPEDLLNYFPKSILPTEYGGSLENYHDADLMMKFNQDHGNFPEGGQKNYY